MNKLSTVSLVLVFSSFTASAFAGTSMVCKARFKVSTKTTYSYEMMANVTLEEGGSKIIVDQNSVRFNVTGIYELNQSELIINAVPQLRSTIGSPVFNYQVNESKHGLDFTYTDLGATSDFAPSIEVTHKFDKNADALIAKGTPCEIVRN